MKHCLVIAVMMTAFAIGPAAGQERGDPRGGGELYRACVACHSLEPDTHLTGPSLAGLFGRKSGRSHRL